MCTSNLCVLHLQCKVHVHPAEPESVKKAVAYLENAIVVVKLQLPEAQSVAAGAEAQRDRNHVLISAVA